MEETAENIHQNVILLFMSFVLKSQKIQHHLIPMRSSTTFVGAFILKVEQSFL